MSRADPDLSTRLWLWCSPVPAEVAAVLDARGAQALEDGTSAPQVLERAAAGGERWLQGELPHLTAVIGCALGLPEAGAAAIVIDQGRGASLVLGPMGWTLERCNVIGLGPHLAARR